MVELFEPKFLKYARGFLDPGDAEVSNGIQLKITHTLMVRRECRAIAADEQWSGADAELAEVIGLGHDFGRFEQFRRFKTFADARSLNHAELGVELLKELGMFDFLGPADREVAFAAIRMHNLPALPEGLDARTRRFAGAIRDADKLDIMRVLVDYYAGCRRDESVTLGLRDAPEVTPGVAETLRRRESPNYRDLKTIPDFLLTTASWVYDLNYAYSRRQYRERGLLDSLDPYVAASPEALEIFTGIKNELAKEASLP